MHKYIFTIIEVIVSFSEMTNLRKIFTRSMNIYGFFFIEIIILFKETKNSRKLFT